MLSANVPSADPNTIAIFGCLSLTYFYINLADSKHFSYYGNSFTY